MAVECLDVDSVKNRAVPEQGATQRYTLHKVCVVGFSQSIAQHAGKLFDCMFLN